VGFKVFPKGADGAVEVAGGLPGSDDAILCDVIWKLSNGWVSTDDNRGRGTNDGLLQGKFWRKHAFSK
jgi:hypothetical protein